MYRFLGESHEKSLTTIALSLSALVATSAMAAPQHHDPRYAPHKPAPHWDHKDAKKWDDRRYNNRGVNPSRDWRVGQKLPNQYDNRRFEVSGYEASRLPKANKTSNGTKSMVTMC